MDELRLRYAVIEVTNRCNLRCGHCASTSGAARDDELSLDEIAVVLSQVAELGGEEITLLGGEVLLRADWLEIAQRVVDLGMRLQIITNGLLLRREETFAALRDLQPHLIGVSLDGASRESYRRQRGVDAFDRVVALLHRLRDEGHRNVNAITTFHADNLSDFDAFADLLDGTGLTWQVQVANRGGERFAADSFVTRAQYAWLAGKMRDVWLTRRDTLHLQSMNDLGYFPLDPALRFLHQTWQGCSAGRELVGIRANGDVLGCLSLAADTFVEANIRQVSLPDIWASKTMFQRFRNKHAQLEGACAACALAERCGAGCSAMAHSATGSIGCNPYCLRALETEEILQGLPTVEACT